MWQGISRECTGSLNRGAAGPDFSILYGNGRIAYYYVYYVASKDWSTAWRGEFGMRIQLAVSVLLVSGIAQAQSIAPAASRSAQTQSVGPFLRLVQTVPLSGVKGRLDHLAADPTHQQLFVAAVDNNTLEVVDLAAGKRIRSVPGFAEPQGVLYLPEQDLLAVTNGGSGLLQFLDRGSCKQVDSFKFTEDADNIRYDAAAGQILVGHGGGALACLDAKRHGWLQDSSLAGHPESFQAESRGKRIFVNVPNCSESPHVKVLLRREVGPMLVDEWYLGDARQNYPMALDEANCRLFVGCREPAVLLVLDTASGKIVDRANIDGDADDIFYDEATRRLYIACGAGMLDVVQQRDADYYKVVERLPTAIGARTCLLVPQTRRLYLAVPQHEGRQAEVRVYGVGAP